MKPKTIFFLIGLVGLFITCDKEESPNPSIIIDKSKLLQLVNEVRTEGCQCGQDYMPPVDPVTWNDLLEEAALRHSNDMYINQFFSHTGSDGSEAGDRISRTGYTWSTYGENIARGYSTEESVIEGWLNSPGHCRNIMNANFTEMGIGKNDSYWTQVFSTPRP